MLVNGTCYLLLPTRAITTLILKNFRVNCAELAYDLGYLMLDADGSKAVHDGRDEADSDADPGNDVGPADVEGCLFAKDLRPRHVEFKALVVDLKLLEAV